MNRIFILQKGKWKPFKMKAVCELVFYSESAMQFFNNSGNYNEFNKNFNANP